VTLNTINLNLSSPRGGFDFSQNIPYKCKSNITNMTKEEQPWRDSTPIY
jgi:hypothetical protein